MALAAPAETKINTNPTQLAHGRAGRRAQCAPRSPRKTRGGARVSGDNRESVRDPGRRWQPGQLVQPVRGDLVIGEVLAYFPPDADRRRLDSGTSRPCC
jgi:hypothetical protein